jgi:integrase
MAGTVRKRTRINGKSEARTTWLADYFDQFGNRHRKTFILKKDADAWLTEAKTEVKAGIHTPDADAIRIEQAAQLWLHHCELDGIERGSLRTYEGYVRLHIVPLIGRKKVSQLTAPLVAAFGDRLLAKVSRQRARSVLAALRMILNDTQRRGLVAQNVALTARIKRGNERQDKPVEIGVDVPSKAEVQAILQHATGRHRARLVILVFTGLRASELRGLGWLNVDFDTRIVKVRERADEWGAIGATKSRNGYRDIPMSPLLVNTLKEWRLASPPALDKFALVFPGGGGKPLHHKSLQWSFGEAQRAAGVVTADGKPKYALHALRHFFASWGIEQGFSPKRLQALLGHGSIGMTFDVYGHLFPSPDDDHARFAAGERAVLGSVRDLAGA